MKASVILLAFASLALMASGILQAQTTQDTAITYTDGSHNNSYIAYDGLAFGVQVDAVGAVPEPGTYAMMLTGLALVGGIGRRRKQGKA